MSIKEILQKLFQPKPPCTHRWTIMIEYYPSFTKDYWQCKKCGECKVFDNNQPPVKIKSKICSLGHVHIANR